jgi:ankyrin repeat protein
LAAAGVGLWFARPYEIIVCGSLDSNLILTFLHCLVLQGREEIAQLLVASGADANARDRCGWSPLHYAAINGDAGLIKVLLKGGGGPQLSKSFA